MSLGRISTVGAAALLAAAGASADADHHNWNATERLEQHAPKQAQVNAPMSHWRPFFLPNDAVDPAFSQRENRTKLLDKRDAGKPDETKAKRK